MRLIIVDKKELEMGIEKESTEHGMSYEQARKTAIDHLKERPDYYSVAEKAGLEEEGLDEWTDSIFTKERTGGRTGRLKKHWNKQKRSGTKQFADVPVGASGGMFTEE
jgi:hypothetical protein